MKPVKKCDGQAARRGRPSPQDIVAWDLAPPIAADASGAEARSVAMLFAPATR